MLTELITEALRSHGAALAVTDPSVSWTYADLEARMDDGAAALRAATASSPWSVPKQAYPAQGTPDFHSTTEHRQSILPESSQDRLSDSDGRMEIGGTPTRAREGWTPGIRRYSGGPTVSARRMATEPARAATGPVYGAASATAPPHVATEPAGPRGDRPEPRGDR